MFDETLKSGAEKLVDNCRNGRERAGLDELYADDAVSVEAAEMNPDMGRTAEGREAIRGKHDWWEANMEVHSVVVDGPWLHGEDRFAVTFEVDATDRNTDKRHKMKEVAIYTVKAGKIVREEFYWAA